MRFLDYHVSVAIFRFGLVMNERDTDLSIFQGFKIMSKSRYHSCFLSIYYCPSPPLPVLILILEWMDVEGVQYNTCTL